MKTLVFLLSAFAFVLMGCGKEPPPPTYVYLPQTPAEASPAKKACQLDLACKRACDDQYPICSAGQGIDPNSGTCLWMYQERTACYRQKI